MVSGCGTGTKTKTPVLVKIPKAGALVIKRGTKFSWGEKVFSDAARFEGENIEQLADALIIDELSKKGLKFSNYPQSSELLVDYKISLSGGIQHNPTEKIDSSNPELPTQNSEIDIDAQGILQLELRSVATGKPVWKNNVSGFTSSEMPDEQRKERVLKLIEIFLEDVPVPIE